LQDLLEKNQTFEYEFSHKNFNIYFTLSTLFPNGTYLNYEGLTPYFKQFIYYYDSTGVIHDVKYEKCSISKQDEFLLLNNEIISKDQNKTSNWSICIKNPYLMGHYPNGKENLVSRPTITYVIQNS